MQSASRVGNSRIDSVRTLNSSLPSIKQSNAGLLGASPLNDSYGLRGSERDHYVVNFDEILKRNNAAEYSTSTSKASPRAPLYPSTMIFDENDTLGIPMSQRPSKQGVYSNNYYQMAVAAPSKKRSISVQKPFVT